ncbi:MAG: small ribosomal subunit biogenesis GTPase RsgA [Gammaproteobacteria bacterium]|nr:small ribosomal subunit biogenesis GTPase RsgA [Gammaproteobacteria bacterium]
MSDKRKLNRQQQARSERLQQNRADQAGQSGRDLSANHRTGDLSSAQLGLVVCRFSKHFEVEALEASHQGRVFKCVARTNLGTLVTGDKVIWKLATDGSGVIESRLDRRSVLERPDNFGRLKAVAANIDQMVIMIAVQPPPQANLIDRYLVAAELMQIRPVLVLNKTDLLAAPLQSEFDSLLNLYQALGYPVARVISSRHQTAMLDQLIPLIKGRTSIIVGQSGVGKSSMINALLPEHDIAVGALSEQSGEGTHTTTTARLFHLPDGGQLIDSPGIRDFGLWHIEPEQLQYGFIEIAQQVGHCKFRDCQHNSEPGCAVLAAVQAGTISEQRFNSFVSIKASIKEQHARGLGG